MKKPIIAIIIFLILLLSARTVEAKTEFVFVAEASALPQSRVAEKEQDLRIKKLESFLLAQKSPLSQYAACFINVADKYDFDRFEFDFLVPAITGVESSFGKVFPQGSYNAYGWAGGGWRFSSWEESIEHVSQTLKQKYIDRGANTLGKIGPIYAESPTWAQRVAYFIKEIESFNPQPDLTI